ncbi:MAG: DUF5777 family beta-barrel protein [Gemmatimonadota bacterium]
MTHIAERSRRALVRAATATMLMAFSYSPAEGQRIFHSNQSANLPTTETLRAGNWLFEISHRFVPPIENGVDALWGLDGPVNNRLGMAWAPAENTLVGFQRSNFQDNLELYAKRRVVQADVGGNPGAIALMGGIAWNTDVIGIQGADDNEMQAYAQLIANVLLADGAVAVGVVPSWLYNPRIRDAESFNSVALGVHGQWYFADGKSLVGEWIFSEQVTDVENDSGTFGIEIETRGHFFKLIVTNQTSMQPTQYLAGSASSFDTDNLRLGFNVTRLLPF